MSLRLLSYANKFNLSRRIATSAFIRNQVTSSSVSSQDLVVIDVNEKTGYATLSLNQLPANTLNLKLFQSLINALDEMEKNKTRGVILTSTSSKIFCSGFDIYEFYKPNETTLRELWSTAQDCSLKLYSSTFPIAAAISGHAIAGGCFFAMTCEYRSMVKNFKIGINELHVGIVVPRILIYVVQNLLSRREAEIAVTTGKLYSTDEAFKNGLIDDVACDKADALKKCEAFLDRFKSIPPIARSKTKNFIRREEIDYLINHKAQDLDDFVKSVMNPEAQNMIKMYLGFLKNKK